MEIYIASDHKGFNLKNQLAPWLSAEKHKVTDLGPIQYTADDDYPAYGIKVARAVAEQPDMRRGIVICGSGAGMAVVANKVKGIRAALLHDPEIAASAQHDDNINVIALGSDFITIDTAQAVILRWLTTRFSNVDRHKRRINQITHYEHQHSCPCYVRSERDVG